MGRETTAKEIPVARLSMTILLAGMLYFSLAVSTILLTTYGDTIATVWPANAALIAVMTCQPRKSWPWIILAGFVANLVANLVMRDGGVLGPVLFGFANMLEVVIVAWGISGYASRDGILRDANSVLRMLFWCCIAGTIPSTLIGATTAALVFGEPYMVSATTWYVADALGLLIFMPFFFALLSNELVTEFRQKSARQRMEACAWLGATLLTAIAVFSWTKLPILFLISIPMTFVTFRLGWSGVKLAAFIVAVVVAIAHAKGVGPFMLADIGQHDRAMFAQFFLATVLLTQMPVAATLNSRRENLEKLKQSEMSTRMLAQDAGIVLLSLSVTGKCTKAVGATKRLLGKNENELIGKRIEAISPDASTVLRGTFEESNDDDAFDQVIEFEAPNRNGHWLEARFSTLSNSLGDSFETLLTIQDITDRRQRETVLAAAAEIDDLTGLLNRAGFTDRAQRALLSGTNHGHYFAMIDVDRFKMINDNLGHLAGDAVLKAISAIMASHLRTTDIFGRLGGDEFAILLDTGDEQRAKDACHRIVKAIATTPIILPSGTPANIAISCGLARHQRGMPLDDLKNNADMALYEAKRGGRNQLAVA